MKKSPLYFARFFSLLCSLFFIFGLFSCSSFLSSKDENGSVSFVIDRSILNAARDGSDIHDENVSYLVIVSLEDNKGFGVKQTVSIPASDYDECMKTDRRFETKFKKIPVGKQIYVMIKIYQIFGKDTNIPESELPEPVIIGKSDPIKVKAGKNEITLNAYNYRYNFDFLITISIEGFNENELMQLEQNLLISAIASDSQDAKRIAAAGTDPTKIYETLYDYIDVESQLASSYGAQFSIDPQRNLVIVKGNMYLPVNLDSAATKGSEVVLIAGVYDLDRYSGKTKTKLFGQSAKISPEKKKTNTVSISAKKMDFIDTPLVTYSETDAGYSYDINGIQQYTTSEKKFCFDREGNVYILNNTSFDGNVFKYDIISSTNDSYDQLSNYFTLNILIDLKTNIMYAYTINDYSLNLYQYPNLISDRRNTDENYWTFNCDTSAVVNGFTTEVDPWPRLCTVYDGTLYIIAEDYSYGYILYKMNIENIESGTSSVIPDGIHLDLPYGDITDLICLDGDLYITGNVFITSWDNFESRGFVLKYNPSENTIKDVGVSSDKREKNSMNNIGLAVYKNSLQLFKNSTRTQPLLVTGSLEVSGNPFNVNFPTICTPAPINKTLSTNALYGASKIIAIKPKKLVISEEGIAFYTENDQLFYKNVNRVVTVNLEDFSMKFDNTDACFDKDIDSNSVYQKSITANSSFWDATVGIGTTLYPGNDGTAFKTSNVDEIDTYYIAITQKQN